MPTDTTVDLPFSALEGGDDGSKGLTDSDYIGDGGARNGLYAFDVIDDVNILAIPDAAGDREVTIAAYTYCQNRKDCFFVADPPNNNISVQDILAYKLGTGLYQGNAFNSSYAALYYPWIEVIDPASETGMTRKVPPSGAVIGTYSYTDTLRGVHKAPAGINEGYLNSAVGIVTEVTHGQQELLNPEGINVIRSLPGAGICIWGARTLSADSEWKYVNVRRLLLFIEESIEEGTQWVVFEPNDRSLWGKVRRDTTAFLSTVWQSGALFGATQQEAFFVKIDDENNPPEMRDLGRLVIDVGVRPVKPAEFVIFRITQMVQGKKA
jgi:phage tail sheath protein FI